jgi:SAM-dependent methyltransferase
MAPLTEAEGLASLISKNRHLLHSRLAPDPYLCRIARELPKHHGFLGKSAQAVYQRQTKFLATTMAAHFGRTPDQLRVLDWGCGKGQNAYLMKQNGFDVVACDIQGEFFGKEIPLLAGIDLVALEDPVKLPFETASFDIVTSFGVLEHVPKDLESMREIHRILKPGGVFFITFLPYPLSWTQIVTKMRRTYIWRDYHDHFYSQGLVRRLASQSRFSVESLWFGQLFPKNSVPRVLDPLLEPIDRALCRTPLRYFATNLEAVLVAT